MFCFRFGNLLVRLLVFEFRNIFSALVFSSISYCVTGGSHASIQRLFCTCFLFLQTRHFVQVSKKRIKGWHANRDCWSARHSSELRDPLGPSHGCCRPRQFLKRPKKYPIDQVDSFTSHSLFIYYPSTSFLFQSLPACWLCMAARPVLFPARGLSRKKRNEKVRCSAGMHVVMPPCSWSWPRGRIIVVTPHHPPRPRSPVVQPRLRIVAVKGHDFLLNLCLLPRYVNAWSHGCRSWSQCERKILTGKYNDD